jgi:hypothetical protein
MRVFLINFSFAAFPENLTYESRQQTNPACRPKRR